MVGAPETQAVASALHADLSVMVEHRRWLVLDRHSQSSQRRQLPSVAEVEAAIDLWASHWNDNPQPFVRTKTVEDIMTKVKRARAVPAESATHH